MLLIVILNVDIIFHSVSYLQMWRNEYKQTKQGGAEIVFNFHFSRITVFT